MIKLDNHQQTAVEFIIKHKKAALFMGVGTGKTYTALEIFKRVKPKRCLIITTAKLIKEKQWHEEIELYLGYLPGNLELISHQMISRRSKAYKLQIYDMIVIDEAHKIKSRAQQRGGTKISRLIYSLSKQAEYVIPMTGTPVGNDFIDIFNIFRNTDIDMWHGWTETQFIESYYYHFYKDWSGAGYKVIIPIELKPYLKDALWNLVRKKAIVVNTNEVLDLKKQHFKKYYVDDMDKTEMYKLIKKKILKYDGYEDTLISLKRINFERQAANGFIYEENEDKTVFEFSDKKVESFGKLITKIRKKTNKIVVTYWFKHDKKRIIDKLNELNISYTDRKYEFAKNKDVFLLHFSDSEGLNLQNITNAMVFYSYQPSYMNFSQICGRIWRRGQKKTCYYFVMITKGTIEERIWDSIKNKKSKDDFIKNELE